MSLDKLKMDLTLFRKLVAEFEQSAAKVDAFDISTKEVQDQYSVELAKTMGLASGLSQECVALVKDMAVLFNSANSAGLKAAVEKSITGSSIFDTKISPPKGSN